MPAVRVCVTLGVMRSESENVRPAACVAVAHGEVQSESMGAPLELVRLLDGSRVTVRASTAADEPALLVFLSGLCDEARRLRFFTGAADVAYAARLASATGADRYGVIAHDELGATVGHATYAQLDGARAEVAVEVSDHLHDRGLATVLIERLAAAAQARGIASFVAEVLPENSAMLGVFQDGFDAAAQFADGTDKVEFATSAWRLALDRFATSDGTR
jgi:L-amino acid N-acyltransferase YncA